MNRLAFFVVASLAMQAMAGNPTTHKSFELLLKADGTAPSISLFNPKDFSLNYRPPLQKLPNLAITPSSKDSNDAQLWHSTQFNGQTVWNRPAIFDSTVHAVQDTRTGYMFYYRDFANTVKVPLELPPYRAAGVGHRLPDPGLIDDRPKPVK